MRVRCGWDTRAPSVLARGCLSRSRYEGQSVPEPPLNAALPMSRKWGCWKIHTLVRHSGVLRVGHPRSDREFRLARRQEIHWNCDMPEHRPRGSKPPHNPALRDLVAGKRKWSSVESRELRRQGFPGWHERGYLPHRDEPGLTQFVTYHAADSFPTELRSEWAAFLEVEDDQERHEQLQAYLDQGRGECVLRRPEAAQVVENALKFYHDQRYELRAWTVMPNHVHVLFKTGDASMARTVEGWKKFTSHEINKRLGRTGQFWAEDYWDTYMRDAEHESRTRGYIENNPVKAFLVRDAKEWPWSSARWRDDYGRLCL